MWDSICSPIPVRNMAEKAISGIYLREENSKSIGRTTRKINQNHQKVSGHSQDRTREPWSGASSDWDGLQLFWSWLWHYSGSLPKPETNLYWKEITTENKAVYKGARKYLEQSGFDIKAVVIDAKHGVKEVFVDTVIQICQYHQQQIIHRYLTSRPKTLAGQELRLLVKSLTRLTELSFEAALKEWHDKWSLLLAERTIAQDKKHWWYTHRQLRAAYRSLHTNLLYLFSYQKYPELRIPNTNNSLEGYFGRLKTLLNNHHGLRSWRRYRLIEEVLNK